MLWRALGDRGGVRYVDVGAFDPTEDSVTRALYERGWRGVNIEAQADRIAAFEEQRPDDVNLALAIGDHDGTTTLAVRSAAGWATVTDRSAVAGSDGATEVPMRTLATLLPELGISEFDVLKVDVEGAEPDVVRGLLAGAIRPLVCVIEGVAPDVGPAAGDDAVALLIAAGYRHCQFDGLNHWLTTDARLVPTSQHARRTARRLHDRLVRPTADRAHRSTRVSRPRRRQRLPRRASPTRTWPEPGTRGGRPRGRRPRPSRGGPVRPARRVARGGRCVHQPRDRLPGDARPGRSLRSR